MVPDPYKALNIPHSATAGQIKNAYRKLALQCHPDRLTRQCASPEEFDSATNKFACISAAYALLTDEKRKREYDHIYKYGGYDEEESKQESSPQPYGYGNQNDDPLCPKHDSRGKRVPQTGIGYAVTDPLSYLLSMGKQKNTTIAGVQIPSRLHLSRQPLAAGLKFAISSGERVTSFSGRKSYTSKTTQFVAGKKYTRVERTTVHPDGRKEIIIEGDNYIERRYTPPTRSYPEEKEDVTQKDNHSLPWYMKTWHGLKDSVTQCYTPCISVR